MVLRSIYKWLVCHTFCILVIFLHLARLEVKFRQRWYCMIQILFFGLIEFIWTRFSLLDLFAALVSGWLYGACKSSSSFFLYTSETSITSNSLIVKSSLISFSDVRCRSPLITTLRVLWYGLNCSKYRQTKFKQV